MDRELQKWGNSVGIRIPSDILKQSDMGNGDILEFTAEKNLIILTKKGEYIDAKDVLTLILQHMENMDNSKL